MPKLNVFVPETSKVSYTSLSRAVDEMRLLVAKAASIPGVVLDEDDVDVDIRIYDPALSTFSQDVAIEIETFAFPDRVAKLDEAATRELKNKLADILEVVDCEVDRTKPLLWLKYVDPRGHHV